MSAAPATTAPTRQTALLDWADRHRRDLPWRRTRDPWAILVSELMLAQTQVTRVIPRWEAFMARWPTATTCAASDAAEVIVAWSGLGYNRRAVYLHRAATAIVTVHGGQVPRDRHQLQALPGVGPYTARAVLAFAFGEAVGVVETNSARVLARAFAGRTLTPKGAQELADDAVPAGRGWEWNQAMLDLGATICTARRPACDRCPLGPAAADQCAWSKRPGADPAVGSAGVSKPQSAFHGSDRQGRGRLLAHLTATNTPVPPDRIAEVAGWPDDPARAAGIAADLVADGLATNDSGGSLRMP